MHFDVTCRLNISISNLDFNGEKVCYALYIRISKVFCRGGRFFFAPQVLLTNFHCSLLLDKIQYTYLKRLLDNFTSINVEFIWIHFTIRLPLLIIFW